MFSTIATPRPSDRPHSTTPHWLSRFATALRGARIATEQAHAQRCLHDHHPDAAFHDAGLPRDDAMATGSHQDALPFFLQSGFGRR